GCGANEVRLQCECVGGGVGGRSWHALPLGRSGREVGNRGRGDGCATTPDEGTGIASGATAKRTGSQQPGEPFFSKCLAQSRGVTPEQKRRWRNGIYSEIREWAQAQGELNIGRMCELAKVSRAGFYRSFMEKAPTEAEMILRDAIQKAALANRSFGYRRITAVLQKQEGLEVGGKGVRRILKQDNLLAVAKRKFVVTTDSNHRFRVYQNVARDLELTDINQLWVADITYMRLGDEFVYLAVLLDAFSRKVIGWALGRTL